MSIWSACALCIVANVIMMTTTHIGALYAGRLIIGLANGMLMTFAQLYIQVLFSSLPPSNAYETLGMLASEISWTHDRSIPILDLNWYV